VKALHQGRPSGRRRSLPRHVPVDACPGGYAHRRRNNLRSVLSLSGSPYLVTSDSLYARRNAHDRCGSHRSRGAGVASRSRAARWSPRTALRVPRSLQRGSARWCAGAAAGDLRFLDGTWTGYRLEYADLRTGRVLLSPRRRPSSSRWRSSSCRGRCRMICHRRRPRNNSRPTISSTRSSFLQRDHSASELVPEGILLVEGTVSVGAAPTIIRITPAASSRTVPRLL